ncbi:MAG TPA: hypothetical protein VK506_11275 [Conexibacter sp.]|nr:hypothetical protein [Conexibacter sp.]
MPRRSRMIAGALSAALACGAGVAPGALAAQQGTGAPSAQAAGLLDGLDDALGGLLGGGQQQQLQGVTGALGGGQAPTGALLAPVRDLLYDVADTPSLPAGTAHLIRQVADLLASAPDGQPLDPGLLAPVETLLRDLAATPDVPPATADLLTELADLIGGAGGGGTPGLPVEALSVVPQTIDELDQLITSLEDGAQPTGTLLAPVADLLNQAADAEGLSGPVAGLLRELANLIRGTTGELDPLLAGQVERVLSTIANTPGLTTEQRSVIERTATLIGQGGASSASRRAVVATKRDRAVIKRVRVNRARTRIVVRIACPRRAPATCATRVTARLAGRKAANPKRVRIAAGRSKVVRLRMVRAARAAGARQGGRLRVRVVTTLGTRRFADAKAVQVKPRGR